MRTMEKVYLDAQNACGLKVGDYVKVLRTPDDCEAGWNRRDYSICEVGKVYQINAINDFGISLKYENFLNYFPYFVLEKVEKPQHEFKHFDKVLVRDKEHEIWRCNIFSHVEYNGESNIYYCVNACWLQCIPYEGNEHLAGTTDMPEE